MFGRSGGQTDDRLNRTPSDELAAQIRFPSASEETAGREEDIATTCLGQVIDGVLKPGVVSCLSRGEPEQPATVRDCALAPPRDGAIWGIAVDDVGAEVRKRVVSEAVTEGDRRGDVMYKEALPGNSPCGATQLLAT